MGAPPLTPTLSPHGARGDTRHRVGDPLSLVRKS